MDVTLAGTRVKTTVRTIYSYMINGVRIEDKNGDIEDLLNELTWVGGFMDALNVDSKIADKLQEAGLVKRCGPNGVHCYGSELLSENLDQILEGISLVREEHDAVQ